MAARTEIEAIIKLRDEVSAKVKQIDRSLGKLDKNFKRGQRSSTGFAGSLRKGTTQALAFGGAAGVAAIGISKLVSAVASGVRGFVSFEKSMVRIETLVGVARGEVEGMNESVRAIAAATGRGPLELSEALFQITSAGLRGKEAIDTLTASARASSVGLGDTAIIADIATSAMNAFGKENINAEQAIGVLLKAVREGKASPEELAASLGKVIPVAASMGISFSEVSGIVASMTKVGFRSTEAVTSIRGAMIAILKPTAQAREVLEGTGLSIESIRRTIKEDGLLAALQDLRTSLPGEAFAKFIGRAEALAGTLAVTGDRFEDTARIVLSTADSMGALDEAMERVADTSAFQAERVSTAWQNTKGSVGEAFIGLISTSLDLGDAVFNAAERARDATPRFEKLGDITRGVFAQGDIAARSRDLAKELGILDEHGGLATGSMEKLRAELDRLGVAGSSADEIVENLVTQMDRAVDTGFEPLKSSAEETADAIIKGFLETGKIVPPEIFKVTESLEDAAAKSAEAEKAARELAARWDKLADSAIDLNRAMSQFEGLRQFQIDIRGAEARTDAASESTDEWAEALRGAQIQFAIMGKNKSVIEGIRLPIERNIDFTNQWRRSIEELADAFRAFGIDANSALGQVIAGFSVLAAQIPRLKKDLQGGKLVGGAIGSGDFAGAAAAGAQGVGAIAQATARGSTGGRVGRGALAGAGAGAQVGGPIGAIIGAAAGAITGFLRGRSAERALKNIQNEVGLRVSEGLLKGIRDSGRPAQLMIGAIFSEGIAAGTASVDDLAREMGDVFSFLQRGEISSFEAINALEMSVPLLLQNLRELGPAGEAEIDRIIGAAKAMGVEFDGLAELIQSTFAPATVESMAEQFGKTNAEIRAMADLLGIDIQTNLERIAASVGLTASEFTALGAAFEEKFGIPAEQLAEFMESTGISAADLADKLGVAVGPGADLAAETDLAGQRLEFSADMAGRLADELERASRAMAGIGGVSFPSVPSFPHGGFVPETPGGSIIRVAEPGTGGEFITPARAGRSDRDGAELRQLLRDLPTAIQRAVISGMQRSFG